MVDPANIIEGSQSRRRTERAMGREPVEKSARIDIPSTVIELDEGVEFGLEADNVLVSAKSVQDVDSADNFAPSDAPSPDLESSINSDLDCCQSASLVKPKKGRLVQKTKLKSAGLFKPMPQETKEQKLLREMKQSM